MTLPLESNKGSIKKGVIVISLLLTVVGVFEFLPVVIFAVQPETLKWQRALRTVVAVILGYAAINLGAHLGMEIKNAPFQGEVAVYVNNLLVTSEADKFKLECFDIADGAKYVFALLFGWVPALVYTGW